uniref:FAM20 C-terminal domain-containing protein n=1 Tax=Globodera rostochiensis TaxID=31243 RepID=A0A914HZI5_GLORO
METQGRVVPKQDSWERFYAQIGSCDLYREEAMIDALLADLNKLEIKHTAIMEGGTQVKLILTFDNDKQAVFKPMRFGRDYETDPNHFYFGDFERHTAEIATFHLDRILGYRRAVPTVGRVVNMTSELMENAERRLRKTFFVSPAKNRCFVSKCDYYCDTTHAICGAPELKEGSVQVFLPDDTSVPRRHNKSPYRRTYSKKTQLAAWQQDMRYCQWKVKGMKQYAHGRRLLDLVDLHLMDYLIGNQDRHHYETFSVFGNDIPSYAIHLDNGRSFGRTDFDDDDILMPFRQCCLIRPRTLNTFFSFYNSPKGLSETLHESLSKDPVFPVLAFKHYAALERRLHKIMIYLLECMDKQNGDLNQMVVDEFHNPTVAEPLPGEEMETEEDETNNDAPAAPPADQPQQQGVGAVTAEAKQQHADMNGMANSRNRLQCWHRGK